MLQRYSTMEETKLLVVEDGHHFGVVGIFVSYLILHFEVGDVTMEKNILGGTNQTNQRCTPVSSSLAMIMNAPLARLDFNHRGQPLSKGNGGGDERERGRELQVMVDSKLKKKDKTT